MVVHHPDRLHVRVADRRTDKLEASTLQGLAHLVRFLGSCGDLFPGSPTASLRSTVRETPDVRVEAPELLLHDQEGFGIPDGGRDLRSVPDDAGVGHERSYLLRIVFRDSHRIEFVEGFLERLAFLQHCEPGKTRLCPFDDEKFEELSVVVFRNAPLGVMVGEERRVTKSPLASLDRIVAHLDAPLPLPSVRLNNTAGYRRSYTNSAGLPGKAVSAHPVASRNSEASCAVSRGFSTIGKCPASSMAANRDPRIRREASSADCHENWTSWRPERMSVGDRVRVKSACTEGSRRLNANPVAHNALRRSYGTTGPA